MPFTQQTVLIRTSDGKNDVVCEDFYFSSKIDLYRIPTGSTTDGLSIPRIIQNVVPASGNASWLAGVLHDAAYRNFLEICVNGKWIRANLTQAEADSLFLEAMESQGVSWLLRKTIYFALRAFGKAAFNRDRQTK